MFFLAIPHVMWDPSFPSRDQTHAPCSGSRVLTTEPPGKSWESDLKKKKKKKKKKTLIKVMNRRDFPQFD